MYLHLPKMDSDSEGVLEIKRGTVLEFLANEVHQYPEVLDRSQTLTAKRRKSAALKNIIGRYERKYGERIDEKKLLKTFYNMKDRLKKKIDLNNSRSRPIKFLDWEKRLSEVMECGGINSDVNNVPDTDASHIKSEENSLTMDSVAENNQSLHSPTSEPKDLLDDCETEETKYLNNEELKRLVLIEQLRMARVQREYYEIKIKRLKMEKHEKNNS